MGDPVFGITFRKIDDEPMPVIGADLSTIGLIGPIDEANPQFYALNIPSKVYSNDTNMLSYLGATGYIPDAFDGINAQLGEFQSAAKVVVVRTLGGTNADAALRTQKSIAHVMGSSLNQTGIWAFLKAPSLLACTARLICAPGYTGQMANSLGELHIGTIGHGYVPGQSYPITFTGGGSSETIVLPTAHAIADVNGDINQFELAIDTFGAWFSEAPLATIPAPEVAVRAIGTSALGADTQAGTVTSLLIGTPGSGYIPGQTYAVVFTGGTPDTPATAHAVPNSLGIIGEEEVYLDGGGTGYETPPTYAVAVPPTAVRATLTTELSTGANPVCTMLPAILEQTIAHAVVESAGTSEILDEDWRETMQSQRLIGVCGGVKVMDPTTGNIIARPIAPRVAGIIVRRDHETGAPFHSAANQPVQGIVGPLRDIAFSITDDANEGQQLLRNNLGIFGPW